jgi:hypothetical protein
VLGRYGDLLVAGAVAALAVGALSGWFTPIRFEQERIEVDIDPGARLVTVDGRYRYTNRSPAPAVLTLRAPFPVDRDHPPPLAVAVRIGGEDGRPWTEIPLRLAHDEARFRLWFWPGESKWVHVEYVQPTRVANARYLLTTTRAWGEPIERAEFELRLPRGVELAASSLPLDRGESGARGPSYRFVQAGFWPDGDWVFAWRHGSTGPAPPDGGQP